jgi:hypothetical protein
MYLRGGEGVREGEGEGEGGREGEGEGGRERVYRASPKYKR